MTRNIFSSCSSVLNRQLVCYVIVTIKSFVSFSSILTQFISAKSVNRFFLFNGLKSRNIHEFAFIVKFILYESNQRYYSYCHQIVYHFTFTKFVVFEIEISTTFNYRREYELLKPFKNTIIMMMIISSYSHFLSFMNSIIIGASFYHCC